MSPVWVTRRGLVVADGTQPALQLGGAACPDCRCGVRPMRANAALLGLTDGHAGSWVDIAVSQRSLTRVAGVCFAGPLACLLGGAWVGTLAAERYALSPDLLGAGMGLGAMALALLAVARYGAPLAQALELRVGFSVPQRTQ